MRWLFCAALTIGLSSSPLIAQETHKGIASFYSGVPDRSQKFTAAHRSLPFGTMVSVRRVDTGAQVVVRINDRGPFIKGRIIDVSHSAAKQLGMIGAGVARVTIQIIPKPAPALQPKPDLVACMGCQLPLLLE